MHRSSILVASVLLAAVACADEAADKEYVARFEKEFPKAAQPAKLEDYATVARLLHCIKP